MFKVAIPILISLVVIRLSVRVLSRTFPGVRWVRIVERSISWLAWIAVVLWVTGVSPMILDAMDDVRWKVGTTHDDAAQPARGRHHRRHRPRPRAVGLGGDRDASCSSSGSGHDLSLRKMAANVIRALLLFVGLLVALSAVGIDLTALSVLGGAIGVGLGFGLQKIAANYISGFVILAERSLRIGDMVKVDTFEGRITDIRTRYTVIRSLSGREAIVPNETLITTRVENASLADPRVLVQTTVQVAYGSDVRALQPKLEAAIRAVPRVIDDPAPACSSRRSRPTAWTSRSTSGSAIPRTARATSSPRSTWRCSTSSTAKASRSRSRSASSTPSSRASEPGARRPASSSTGARARLIAVARPAQEPAGSERRCR